MSSQLQLSSRAPRSLDLLFFFLFQLPAKVNKEETQAEEMEMFAKLYQEGKGPPDIHRDSSYKDIPKFYFKVSEVQ